MQIERGQESLEESTHGKLRILMNTQKKNLRSDSPQVLPAMSDHLSSFPETT